MRGFNFGSVNIGNGGDLFPISVFTQCSFKDLSAAGILYSGRVSGSNPNIAGSIYFKIIKRIITNNSGPGIAFICA